MRAEFLIDREGELRLRSSQRGPCVRSCSNDPVESGRAGEDEHAGCTSGIEESAHGSSLIRTSP